MKFEWITDWDYIFSDDFEDKWNKLYKEAKNKNIFMHPALIKTWLKTYKNLRNFKPLFNVYYDKNFIVFSPLLLWKKNWKNAFINTIIPAGYSDFDYNTPIVVGEDIDNINKYWDYLIKELELKFGNLFDTIELPAIQENFKSKKFIHCDNTYVMNLKEYINYDDFLKTFKSKERNDIKRQTKRLNDLGKLTYKKVNGNKEGLIILEEMLYHHSLKWPNAYKAPKLHKNILINGLKNNILHFSYLKLNDEIIAWNFSFKDENTYYYYMPAFKEKYKKYSPGKVLLHQIIKEMIENKKISFDFLRGSEEYKFKYPVTEKKLYCFSKNQNNFKSKSKKLLLNLKRKFFK